ncbi:hypothetical protein AB0O64_26690 [Streptomyces sp. NPDC088341]|uniref:hypothetical protein n=1 Tax=Streptomyces sp. NPDC088341 TaxID=3154870 RepID=UPI003421FE02
MMKKPTVAAVASVALLADAPHALAIGDNRGTTASVTRPGAVKFLFGNTSG